MSVREINGYKREKMSETGRERKRVRRRKRYWDPRQILRRQRSVA